MLTLLMRGKVIVRERLNLRKMSTKSKTRKEGADFGYIAISKGWIGHCKASPLIIRLKVHPNSSL
jgi:hypothetical protein